MEALTAFGIWRVACCLLCALCPSREWSGGVMQNLVCGGVAWGCWLHLACGVSCCLLSALCPRVSDG